MSRKPSDASQATHPKNGFRVVNEAVESVPTSKLVQHPDNPRRGNVAAISESIEANGFYGAVVAQKSTGRILAGNHRFQAAIESGATEVPVAWVDVDDDTARRIMLADNRTNDIAQYDDQALAALLKEALSSDGGLTGTGYTSDDVDALLAGLSDSVDDDDSPTAEEADELLEKWGVEEGQVWAIPSLSSPHKTHRVVCGDSTNANVVAAVLDGAEPNLMVTDPPYGVEYDATWRGRAGLGVSAVGAVTNDDRHDWGDAFALFSGDVAYVWHAGSKASGVEGSLARSGLLVRSQIIWNKSVLVISRGHYHPKHECCWYCVRKGCSGRWNGSRKESTVWDIDKPHKSETGHSTQKPIECMARPIRNHSGDVYDPFLGSGTTMVAAESLGRACYGIELNPAYVAIALERMHRLGLAPERAGTVKEADDAA